MKTCFFFAAFVSSAVFANASQLFSSSGVNGPALFLIDQASATPTRVMDLSGLASDLSSDGQPNSPYIWAVTNNQLAKIRPTTQQVVSTVALDAPVDAIAVELGTSRIIGVTGSALAEVNSSTGEVAVIGTLSQPLDVESLTFDNNGILYGIGSSSLFSVNTTDATVNVINDSVPVSSRSGLAVRPSDGTMFLATNDSSYALFTIDANTGARTFVGNTLLRPDGLAFASVPEPAAAGLLTLALVVLSCRHHLSRF